MKSSCRLALAGMFTKITAFLSLGMLLVFASGAWAQTSISGTVGGQVVDQQNAAVPGADVTLTDTATNIPMKTSTNAEGRYVFPSVPPGTYNVSFEKSGFETFKVGAQKVQIGQVLTLNATLKIGSAATTVEVTATAGAELQTMNATVGNTLSNQSLLVLPNLGRDATSMAILQPGTAPTGNAAGAVVDLNTYQLDGANITDDMGGNVTTYQTNMNGIGGSQTNGSPSGVIPTPIESIEEFKVSVSNQTSDFNNSSGAQIQMSTKRGSNQFHGAAYLFYFDNAIGEANSWSNNHTPYVYGTTSFPDTPVDFPKNHRSRFGGALGGPITPKAFLGGKWFFFANYEGLRYPNAQVFSKTDPSALLRAGVIQVPSSTAGVEIPINLNPVPVTVNGITYPIATCPSGTTCDPRGIGLNPIVNDIWSKQMPIANNPLGGDTYNTQAFLGNIREPLTTNNYVGRIDHDFSDKEHFYVTYRDYKLVNLTGNQTDVGGVIAGTFGNPIATAPRPQQPSVWTAGLTTVITPSMTNTFVFSYLRQFWQWSDDNGPPQGFGLGGALEIGGESTSALIPYNVNTQSIRQRFWDGQDKQLRDDLTLLKGNHLFSFGGAYARNFDYHSRTDNGAAVNDQISYLSTSSNFNWTSPVQYIPTNVPSSSYSTYETEYAEVLGLISSTQVMYTRTLPNLALGPLGTPATDKDVIPYYSVYFQDYWHLKPSFTLTYGLGWNLEMPPYELQGKQVALVDSNGQPITASNFLAQRESAALQGNVYTPEIGYQLVRGIGTGLKYPYDPYYGEFSPRINFAWNPHASSGLLGKMFGNGKTVIRGGYSRIFGRLNGVDLVLVPLLGPGLLQGVTCVGPLTNGTCAGPGVPTPLNGFRIGTDGLSAPLAAGAPTLPQPYYPGGANPESVDSESLDPSFKPDRTDNFTITLQRELNSHMHMEVGYIGKIIKNEYQEQNIDEVPYMTTLGGETFAQAYAQLYEQMFFNGVSPTNVTTQSFFETALGGTTSAFCKGYTSCTAAVASNYGSLIKETAVSDLWNKIDAQPSWILGRSTYGEAFNGGNGQATSINLITSKAYGNYNALFVTLQTNAWHGLTSTSNFTWGRALGTGNQVQASSSYTALDPFHESAQYGAEPFDYKFVYNLNMYYAVPFGKGQHGVIGHIIGGWTIAPLFTAQSGAPGAIGYSEGSCSGCEAFGEVTTPGVAASSADSNSNAENAVAISPFTGGNSAHYGVAGGTGNNLVFGAASVGTALHSGILYGLNEFANPAQVYSEFRPCVLGFDTSCGGGAGGLRGLPTWNLDTQVVKDLAIYQERLGAQFFFTFTNVLNHFQPSTSFGSLTSPTSIGQITGQANSPRSMEFGLRLHF
ncbi:MAG TPA: carboxypeptidase-like regulatory domain-containing protein [Bryobacteraceae bacterium]|nr:carboxypeptidase-like regulatory domain-containing protein [Bryobacteraceae bacterium]